MTSPFDPFRHDDAAYVMGALDDAERLTFEAHLESCPACRDRVAEARETLGLLAGVSAAELELSTAPMPDTVLPGLLRAAGRQRSRTRWLAASLGAAAAAAVTALVIVMWPTGSGGSRPPAEAMTAVRHVPVTATATLVSRSWGTEIDVECRYFGEPHSLSDPVNYVLTVFDRQGERHSAGGWGLIDDRDINYVGGTWVPKSDIDKLEISLDDGTTVFQLDL